MKKWGALISRLQQQYSQQADESVLLNTALMLVAELQTTQTEIPATQSKVSVILPYQPFDSFSENHEADTTNITATADDDAATDLPDPQLPEVSDVVIEPVRESEAETNAVQNSGINILAEEKYNDVIEQVPTLVQQQSKVFFELNDTVQTDEPSINDKLKTHQPETASKIQNEPVKDLKKAIGINDKYLFMKELFRNDETAYERSIKTINAFNILPEAEYWIQREMKYKLGWDDNNPTVQAFYQLVRRRFA